MLKKKLIEGIAFIAFVLLLAESTAFAAPTKTKFAAQPVKDWELVSSFMLGAESIRLSSCDPDCGTSRTRGNEILFGLEGGPYYMGTRRGPKLGYFPIKFDVGLKGLYTQTWRMNVNEPGDLDSRTIGLLLSLRFPVTDHVNVEFARGLGYSVTRTAFDNGLIAESRDVSPMTVIGAEYRVNDTFAFFADVRHMKNRHHFGGVTAAANGIALAKGSGSSSRDDRDCEDGEIGTGSGTGNAANNGSFGGGTNRFSNSLTETNLGAFFGVRIHLPFALL